MPLSPRKVRLRSTWFFRLILPFGILLDVLRRFQGQANGKGRSVSHAAIHTDGAAMLLYNMIRRMQSQAGALAHIPGRKKGIENTELFVFADTLSGVLDSDFSQRPIGLCANFYTALIADSQDRIVQNMVEGLVYLS